MSKGKVLLGMSGGIDSSLSALLLQEQGYEVVGLTMRMWESPENDPRMTDDRDSISEAKAVAQKLNIEHHVGNIENLFHKEVICNFVDEYMAGRTPNPCVHCNTTIKWTVLLENAKILGCNYIATGHYAKIKEINNTYFIQKAADELKDQSYFLWGVNQKILSKTILPLGEYTKEQIKELAKKRGFVRLAEKKESQEICFIHDNDYRRFISEESPESINNIGEGNFILEDGTVVGKHKGFPFYTIGQRKGLQIALGEPMYVLNINAEKNEVTIGKRSQMYKNEMHVSSFMLNKELQRGTEIETYTKVRYKSAAIKSTIKITNDKIRVQFSEPVFAITPGQSAVFYDGDIVIGGGLID